MIGRPLIVFSLAATFGTTYNMALSVVSRNNGTFDFNYLGTVEGKSYFAEEMPLRNWSDAYRRCSEIGMRLATITSFAQAELLIDAENITTFIKHHWVGGRDSLTLQQVVWDHDLTSPDARILPFASLISMNACLAFHVDERQWHLHLCTDEYRTLCEIYHGKV